MKIENAVVISTAIGIISLVSVVVAAFLAFFSVVTLWAWAFVGVMSLLALYMVVVYHVTVAQLAMLAEVPGEPAESSEEEWKYE